MKKSVILIKLGGSLITDKTKPFTARPRTIGRLARELRNFITKRNELIILGHGSGSFGHTTAAKYKTRLGFNNDRGRLGAAKVFDAAAQLNRIVVGQLIKQGLPAVGFPPSSLMLARKGKVHSFYLETVLWALRNGMLPVVYGDAIVDEKQGSTIFSTETVLSSLADFFKKLDYKVEKIVHCGITDGVLDKDGETIKKITKDNFSQIKNALGSSAGIDVTGGMMHKVEESLGLARKGVPSLIINGKRNGELFNALSGKTRNGTEILK